MSHRDDISIRLAGPGDELALAALAALDSQRAPAGRVLLAELDGALVAAYALRDGQIVADPFRPTRAVVELLVARGAQLQRRSERARTRLLLWERLWHRAAPHAVQ